MTRFLMALRATAGFLVISVATPNTVNALSIDPKVHNFGWKIQGSAPVAPTLVFDNGRKVYLKFREDAEIPTIFSETPNGLQLLNWASEPPYVVVPNIKGALRLRLDGNETRITKRGYFQSAAPLLVTGVQDAPEPEGPVEAPSAETTALPTQERPQEQPQQQAATILVPELFTVALTEPSFSASFQSAEPVAETATTPIPTPTPPVEVAPPPEPVMEEWPVSEKTLRETVVSWGDRAGWYIQWNQEDLDYPIVVPFVLKGDFVTVINELFSLYADADRKFRVQTGTEQRIVVVSERKQK